MKQQATQYLALDVHQATIVASLRDEEGSVRLRATVPTEASAVVGLVRAAGPRVRVALEEGTQAQWLHDLIKPHAEAVIVCSTRDRKETDKKSDQIDADRLSELLRLGALKSVYHEAHDALVLKELVRGYANLVDDATRTMYRIKALFRSRGIRTAGIKVFGHRERDQWLSRLESPGARFRAEQLLLQLDTLQELRERAKTRMVNEARQRSGWRILRSIPFIGPIRTAYLLAIVVTPFRFRTKRQLWPYCGLAVVTRTSGEQEFTNGVLRRRRHLVATRGLNRNHNRMLKNVFKGAANAALLKPGPLHDFYDQCVARGVRPELAKVTLARKIAAITLRLWKKGELWDPKKVILQATCVLTSNS
jgi:transposase